MSAIRVIVKKVTAYFFASWVVHNLLHNFHNVSCSIENMAWNPL